jgi:5,6-dimethylbenzimidazole synthase
MSNKNILITGGCRSGKSRQALSIANNFSGRKIFLATAEPLDDEMKDRIARHQKERGKDWITREEPLDPVLVLKQEGKKAAIIVMDCLTLWVSNMMMKNMERTSILEKMEDLISECARAQCTVILITNEVGAGIVPDNNLSRSFRDIAGEANQIAASKFDQVVHMVSGIPVTIKSEPEESSGETANDSVHEFSPQKKQGLYEAIYKRRDIRHFNSDPIDPEVLGRILDAAHHAGSVGFMQPWNFLIIHDQKLKEKVASNFKSASAVAAEKFTGDRKQLYNSLKLEGILDSPINICVTCDSSRLGPNVLGRDTIKETDLFSTCCAIQNLWLAARAEGLAVGWVSILSQEQLKKDLEIPDHVSPVAYLCLGHTDEFYKKPMLESAGWANRMPLDSLIYYNKWKGSPKEFSVQIPNPSQS